MTTTDEQTQETAGPSAEEKKQALTPLLLVIGSGALLSYMTGTAKTVLVVVAVIAMIMLHELGHFVTAKWGGMKVTEYFLGFGPRLWSIRKGETEYGVKAIPAGGYVRIIGMNNLEQVDADDESRTYRQQPFWRRLSVAVAGSTMHFIIAFILLWVLNTFVGVIPPDAEPQLEVGSITKLEKGRSPAQEAGFQIGDKLISIDGRALNTWDDLPRYVRQHPDEVVTFVVERDGRRLELQPKTVDLAQIKVDGQPAVAEPTGFVGIGPSLPVVRTDALTAVGRAGQDTASLSKLTVRALGSMLSFNGIKSYGEQLTGGPGPVAPSEDEPRFLSPVGFVKVADQLADSGLRAVLFLLVSINIFVGIFNMIPLLPLDGGHVSIAVYEKIRSMISGRRYVADVTKMLPLTYAVVLVLIFLGVSSLYLDIVRPIQLP